MISINNENNTSGYIVKLYIDGERVHNYTYNPNFYSIDNFDVYFNALMIDTLISTGAFRLSSLKFTSSVLSDIEVMSLGMRIFYILFVSPIYWIWDFIVNGGF